jgi:hypothetical protein
VRRSGYAFRITYLPARILAALGLPRAVKLDAPRGFAIVLHRVLAAPRPGPLLPLTNRRPTATTARFNSLPDETSGHRQQNVAALAAVDIVRAAPYLSRHTNAGLNLRTMRVFAIFSAEAGGKETMATQAGSANSSIPSRPRKASIVLIVSAILLLIAAAFFLHQIAKGIWFLRFTDEPEHLVGGEMLDRGAILYRDFVSQHGPFIFVLTQIYGAVFGWAHPNYARLIVAVLAIVAFVGIARFPGKLVVRLWSCTLFLALIASVWLVQGLNFVSYYPTGGFLVAISLGVLVAPLWCGAASNTRRGFAGGAALALAAATAYSFAPACVLLACSVALAERINPNARGATRGMFFGIAVSAAALFAWFWAFGDLGGYVAFHLVENQVDFAPYIHFGVGPFLNGLKPSFGPLFRVNTLAVFFGVAALFLLLAVTGRGLRSMRYSVLLGGLGLLSLLSRGPYIQDGAFVVASIALFSMTLPLSVDRLIPERLSSHWSMPLLIIGLPVLVAQLMVFPASYAANWSVDPAVFDKTYDIGVSHDPLYQQIRALDPAGAPILALPYEPDVYLFSARLPMRGYFQYFPWDADYARHPWAHYRHDICQDLPQSPPALIYLIRSDFPFLGTDGHYLDCVVSYIARHYRPSKRYNGLYVRSDLVEPTVSYRGRI